MIIKFFGYLILIIIIINYINKNINKNINTEKFTIKDKDEEIKDHGLGVFPALLTTYNKFNYVHEEDLLKHEIKNISKIPNKNKLDINEYEIYNDKIQSFNTNIKVKNKNRIIYELDNKIFNKNFKNLINEFYKKYIEDNVNYLNLKENNFYKNYIKDKSKDKNTENNFKLIEKENLTKLEKKYYENSKNIIMKQINNIQELKLNYPNLSEKINNDFNIVKQKLNNIIKHKNYNEYIFDFELVIYREYKNHGKHINCQVFVKNGSFYYITFLKILGVVSEDKIILNKSSNLYPNNIINYKYNNNSVITNLPREKEISSMSQEEKSKLLKTRFNKLLYDRGLVDSSAEYQYI
jgi:hypothetical protein